MAKHAILSPSGSVKWTNCHGAPRMEQIAGKEATSPYASEGTAAHFLASEVLSEPGRFSVPREWRLTRTISVVDGVAYWSKEAPIGKLDGYYFLDNGTDNDMCELVQQYLNALQDYCGEDGMLFAEQALSIECVTAEEGAEGTSDAIIVLPGELQVHDYKHGRKAVSAEYNTQMLVYAAGAVNFYEGMFDFDVVTMVIHQPRLGAPSSWSITLEEFNEWVAKIKESAVRATEALNLPAGTVEEYETLKTYLYPGDHCRKGFCKARATCPALSKEVTDMASEPVLDCLDLTTLAEKAKAVPMIEDWCKEVSARLHLEAAVEGNQVPGFKVIKGRDGNRKFDNDIEVEALLKSMKIKHDVIYDYKLASPTKLEEAFKAGAIGPRQWPKVVDRIVREPGGLKVVPESHKGAPIIVDKALDDFDIVE